MILTLTLQSRNLQAEEAKKVKIRLITKTVFVRDCRRKRNQQKVRAQMHLLGKKVGKKGSPV